MKRILFTFLLIGCISCVGFGLTPKLNDYFGVSNHTFNISSFNGLSTVDLCDQAPGDQTGDTIDIDPPCIDISDGNEDPDQTVFGHTEKDAQPLAMSQSPIVKTYKLITGSNYEYVEESALTENELFNDGKSFIAKTPVVDLYTNDIAIYKFELVRNGQPTTFGHVKVWYPGFWGELIEEPQFP